MAHRHDTVRVVLALPPVFYQITISHRVEELLWQEIEAALRSLCGTTAKRVALVLVAVHSID
jgi:hypothetical protein